MPGRPVTPRQLEVLRWVADGCPQNAWSGDTHKLSARALEARGLITVSRRNGTWSAVLRPAGQHYLGHGEYPRTTASSHGLPVHVNEEATAAPRTRQRARGTDCQTSPRCATAGQTSASRITGRAADLRDQRGRGSLTVESASEQEHANLDAQVRAIRRFGKLPPGLQLLVKQPSWSKRVLTIVPLPDWMSAEPVPVPVPPQLRNPHPAVAALRDSDRLPVSGPPRNRALRLLQALATAAAERSYGVTFPHSRSDPYGYQERDLDHLRFGVRGHDVGVRVVQLKDRSKHVPTARELAEKQRYSWTRIPDYDYTPSDRLRFEMPGRFEYQQSTWTDGVKSRVEGKLAGIFRELEFRADAAERQRQADEERRRQEELEERRRIARATIKLNETHRAEVLKAQLAAWQHARQFDDYLAAMDARITQIHDREAAAAAREWLAWARAYVASLDPLDGALAMPSDPEPTPAALAPFLERGRGFW